MSDLAPQFYNAFCAINGFKPKWLYCAWHVDKNWQEEIRSTVRGTSKEETLEMQANNFIL